MADDKKKGLIKMSLSDNEQRFNLGHTIQEEETL
jgi:hypothetical protein